MKFCNKFISYPPKTSSLLISPLCQFSDIGLDFSDISSFLSGQRDFFGAFHSCLECLEAEKVNLLKAGECKVVAGLFFLSPALLYELLSHLWSCCWALAQGWTCSARALQAQLDEMLLQPSSAERSRERSFKKQTKQANSGLAAPVYKRGWQEFPCPIRPLVPCPGSNPSQGQMLQSVGQGTGQQAAMLAGGVTINIHLFHFFF